ncbi:unnamed protein product [Paramecium primaurelia]|uniref:WD40-repeat-containing domain n=1 Tax=Paramecium primaurelia TaxID=5886 RepID=A0A8S1PHW7_PARPR|nr:unnamed protein product [Paramecium primaurelia]
MKKKLSLSSKPLSYIQLDDKGRNSYCKSHCLKYEQFEYRNGNCYLCCEQKECNQDNEPLSQAEIITLLNQILSQTISDEFKQQQKQKLNSFREDVNKTIEIYCDRVIQNLEKNCEQQNQINQKIKFILENLENENINQLAYEILQTQQLDCISSKIGVTASLTQEFYRQLTKCETTLNCIHSLTQDDHKNGKNEYHVLKNQVDFVKMKNMQFLRQHEISIRSSKQSIKRIYQDIKNQQIIAVSPGQEINNQITIIKPSQYSLFGQFESLKNSIPAELFSISPNGEFYAWGSNSKIQIYQLSTKIYKQINCHSTLDSIVFNIVNDFVISTQDQKINFWSLNDKNWEFNCSFNMLPERVHDLTFIEDGKKLICKSLSKLTILIKENQNWIIYQQIHQSFTTILWNQVNQMIITSNQKDQIQIWQRNKKGLFQLISTEWDPENKKTNYEVNPLQANDDGSLLSQCQNNKLKVWQVQEDGKLELIFEQEIDENNIFVTNDFTNLLTQNEKSLIWYQLTNDEQ